MLCYRAAVDAERTTTINTLTAWRAERLVNVRGRDLVFLSGLTTLSDEAVGALARHKGNVWLHGLTTLSDEAARALRANPNVRLPDTFK